VYADIGPWEHDAGLSRVLEELDDHRVDAGEFAALTGNGAVQLHSSQEPETTQETEEPPLGLRLFLPLVRFRDQGSSTLHGRRIIAGSTGDTVA